MAKDGGVSCLRSSEMLNVGIGGMEPPPLDLDEVHVLAVDDSLVDRIVIERLLRITSCKGSWRLPTYSFILDTNDFILAGYSLKKFFFSVVLFQSRRLIADGVL